MWRLCARRPRLVVQHAAAVYVSTALNCACVAFCIVVLTEAGNLVLLRNFSCNPVYAALPHSQLANLYHSATWLLLPFVCSSWRLGSALLLWTAAHFTRTLPLTAPAPFTAVMSLLLFVQTSWRPGGASLLWAAAALQSLSSDLRSRYGAGASIVFRRGPYAAALQEVRGRLGDVRRWRQQQQQ